MTELIRGPLRLNQKVTAASSFGTSKQITVMIDYVKKVVFSKIQFSCQHVNDKHLKHSRSKKVKQSCTKIINYFNREGKQISVSCHLPVHSTSFIDLKNVLAGVANNVSDRTASPQCTVRCGLVGEGTHS